MAKTKSINTTLSTEVLYYIFQYMEAKELLTLAIVCRLWNTLLPLKKLFCEYSYDKFIHTNEELVRKAMPEHVFRINKINPENKHRFFRERVIANDILDIELMLRSGKIDVNSNMNFKYSRSMKPYINFDNISLLIFAAFLEKTEIMKLLLTYGADPLKDGKRTKTTFPNSKTTVLTTDLFNIHETIYGKTHNVRHLSFLAEIETFIKKKSITPEVKNKIQQCLKRYYHSNSTMVNLSLVRKNIDEYFTKLEKTGKGFHCNFNLAHQGIKMFLINTYQEVKNTAKPLPVEKKRCALQ